MIRDEFLEVTSDKIRMGTPVGIHEAIAAINYQTAWQKHRRQNVWWRRLIRWAFKTEQPK